MRLKPEIIKSITELAMEYDINKVVLFGSRARGDNTERSDVDLAVSGGNIAAFSVDVEERVPTLLFFDVVDLDRSVQPELLASIQNEGVVLYEKGR